MHVLVVDGKIGVGGIHGLVGVHGAGTLAACPCRLASSAMSDVVDVVVVEVQCMVTLGS